MARGMRLDLAQRFDEAEAENRCVVATSASDGRRLRAAVARNELVSPASKVFARAESFQKLSPRQRALQVIRTLAELHPSWVFCGISAAIVLDLSVSYDIIGNVQVATTTSGRSRNTRGIDRYVISDDSYEEIDGIRITTPPRTVFDCLRHNDFRNSLALADSVLRAELMTQEEAIDFFERMSGRFDNKWRAIETMRLADGRSESGGESVARAVMLERGFRLPDLQHVLVDPISNERRRVDFFWQQQGGWPDVIGELDGRQKYQVPAMTKGRSAIDVLSDERLRESRISLSDARIVRFSYSQVNNADFFTFLLSSFGVPRDAEIPPVARGRYDREALFTRYERLFMSRSIAYMAERHIAAAS